MYDRVRWRFVVCNIVFCSVVVVVGVVRVWSSEGCVLLRCLCGLFLGVWFWCVSFVCGLSVCLVAGSLG